MSESLLIQAEGQGEGQGQQQQQQEPPKNWTKEDGAFEDGWISRLPEPVQQQGKETLAKYKSLGELASAHSSLQVLLGKKANAVLIPNEKSTPEDIAAYRKALGIPETFDKYEIAPEKLPEGVTLDPKNLDAMKKWAHANNVPPGAVKDFVENLLIPSRIGESKQTQEQIELENQKRQTESIEYLREQWGPKLNANLELVRRAANTAGIDPNSEGFSDANVVLAFGRIASLLSEDKLVKGDAKGHGNPAQEAKAIRTDKNHPMYERYQRGDQEVIKYARNLDQRAETLGMKA